MNRSLLIASLPVVLAARVWAAPAVSPEYSVSPAVPGPAAEEQTLATSAFAGGSFLTAWADHRSPLRRAIYGARCG